MLLKDKVKFLRKTLGINQQNLADTLGCKIGKIKQIETGKTATISYADAKLLEKKYKINEQWLRFDDSEMFIGPTINDFDLLEEELNCQNTISIPFYTDIKVSAGTGCVAAESCKEYIKIPKMFLPDDYSSLEILSVHGDSMESTFYDNDLIIIDKSKKDFINGKIFIVLYDDELYVKRMFRLPKDRIILKSDNQYYPDIEIVSDNFKIIGQVIKALNFKNL